jgi:hypothetical protein
MLAHSHRTRPRSEALDELIDSYRVWLLRERGLAEATVRRCESTARRFLVQRGAGGDLGTLTGAEVSAFLLGETGRRGEGTRRRVALPASRS